MSVYVSKQSKPSSKRSASTENLDKPRSGSTTPPTKKHLSPTTPKLKEKSVVRKKTIVPDKPDKIRNLPSKAFSEKSKRSVSPGNTIKHAKTLRKKFKRKKTTKNSSTSVSKSKPVQHVEEGDEVETEKNTKYKVGIREAQQSRKPKRSSTKSSSIAGSNNSTIFSESLGGDATLWERLVHNDRLLSASKLIALLLGLLIGYILKWKYHTEFWTQRNISYVAFPAEIFNSMSNALKTPLMVSSIIAGVGSVDLKICRFMTILFLSFTIGTMYLSTILGVFAAYPVALAIKGVYHRPGTVSAVPNCNSGTCFEDTDLNCIPMVDQNLDLLRHMFPANFMEAGIKKEITYTIISSPMDPSRPQYNSCAEILATPNHDDLTTFEINRKLEDTPNFLGSVIVAMTIAICTICIGDPAQPFVNFFISLSEIHLKIGTWALWISPIGICSATAANVLTNESPLSYSASLCWFLLFALFSLLCYTFVLLPLIYYAFVRKLPFKFFWSISPIVVTAFGTGSSSVTVPMTIYGLEEYSHLDPRVVRLGIPVLTYMNFFLGASIFAAEAFIYCVVIHGASLTFGELLAIANTIFLVTLQLSKSFGGDPPRLPVSLASLNYNTNFANSVFPIYWIADQVSAVTNVVNNCVATAIVHQLSRRRLRQLVDRDEKALKEMELVARNEEWEKTYRNDEVQERQPSESTIVADK